MDGGLKGRPPWLTDVAATRVFAAQRDDTGGVNKLAGRKGRPLTTDRNSEPAAGSVSGWLWALLAFALLTAVYLRPPWRELGAFVCPDPGDPLFNLYVVKWVVAQVQAGFPDLWSPPVFYPTRRVLTFSDHLLGPSAQAALLSATGLTVETAFNLLFLVSFVLSGFATWYVLRRAGTSWPAALAGGAIFAFSPYRWDQLSHFQVLQAQWIPLTLWFWDRLLAERTWRRALPFLAFYLLHVTGGTYLAYMIHLPLAVLFLHRMSLHGRRLVARRSLAVLGAVLLVCAALAMAVFLPYLLTARQVDIGHDETAQRLWGASVLSFLSPTRWSWYSGPWSLSFFRPENALFAGFLPTLLAAYGIFLTRGPRRPLAMGWGRRLALAACLALAALGVVGGELHTWTGLDRFTLAGIRMRTDGYWNPFYLLLAGLAGWALLRRRWTGIWPSLFQRSPSWDRGLFLAGLACLALSFPMVFWTLAEWLPGLGYMRVPARFYVFISFALALAAARGLDHWLSRMDRRRWLPAVGVVGLLVIELAPRGIPWRELPGAGRPPEEGVYAWIARQEEITALLEVPFGNRYITYDTTYMYRQTFHHKPLANGYSGHIPLYYHELQKECCYPVPDAETLVRLRRMGVSHLVLHQGRKARRNIERVDRFLDLPGVSRVWTDGHDSVFRISPDQPGGREGDQPGGRVGAR